jgi:hypothetical protein
MNIEILNFQFRYNNLELNVFCNKNLQQFVNTDRYKIFNKRFGNILVTIPKGKTFKDFENEQPQALITININDSDENIETLEEFLQNVIMLFELHHSFFDKIIETIKQTYVQRAQIEDIIHRLTIVNMTREQKIEHEYVLLGNNSFKREKINYVMVISSI